MALSLNAQLKQTQRLTMTQSLRQQIEMLQLSTIELVEAINEELESNPVLELDDTPDSDPGETLSNDLARELSHDFPDGIPLSYDGDEPSFSDGDTDGDRKRQFIENAVAYVESLSEHLLEQTRLLPLDGRMMSLVEKVITSLDEHGFFISDIDIFARENSVSREDVINAIGIIQTCEPAGCASSGVKETLLVQARALHPDDHVLHRLIDECFDLLSGLYYEKIAKTLSLSVDEVHEKGRMVQSLNPYPGRVFSHDVTRFIIPDIEVRFESGEVIVIFSDEYIPRIRISSVYLRMLAKKNIDKKLKEYIRDKMGAAKQLMKNIAGRRETIEKVVRAVMMHQTAFLERGPGNLKPLTYAKIAEIIGCHESTVSRVSSNKFMRCQWGTFELRYFFASKIRSGADLHSSDEALSLIRDIVAREKPGSPLSDDEIAVYMEGAGVSVARRTIAKYRDILSIPSSSKRKRLNLLKAEGGEL
jgi:RNA polymerase sigma-54 factor